MQPGVQIYTSNRLEDLLLVLAERLAHDPLPPLRTETILVPGQGMARWLRFGLADHHGIAAGLEFPFPGAFLEQLTRGARGNEPDLFTPEVLTLRIHRLLGEPALQKHLGPAARYCEDDFDGRKRLQLSQRLAACLDDYQLYRADLLDRAAAGDDLGDHGPHAAWQARLWRALLGDAGLERRTEPHPAPTAPLLFAELAEPAATAEPWQAHRLECLRRLLAAPRRAAAVLPPRLSVFGASTLPPALLELLFAIAAHVPVALYMPTPSPHYFGDQRARGRPTGEGNGLLARLGTEVREFHDALIDHQEAAVVTVERRDLGTLPAAPLGDLLSCLHHDLAHVTEHGSGHDLPKFRLSADDDSLRVHDCHSAHRELEVVRDQILAAFAADAELAPHEILVLVPDIERYAPFVHAVFGPVERHLPYTVADKSPVAEQPVCAAIFRMLQLAQSRLLVHDVLHLLETTAVQRRFGLFASDLPILRHLCERAGIRWGLDGESRQRRFKIPAFDDNSWQLGIERMMLGVATGPVDDLVFARLPVADTTAGREPLLERLLVFLRSLFGALRPLQRPHTLATWAELVDDLATAMFAPSADDEPGLAALRDATAALRAVAARARHTEPVAPIVLQDWLRTALQQAANSQGFLGGKVTVAALLPMRAVPVQCLFLCGLDDRSFPRRDNPAPFDLGAAPRRLGDRSPRLDDRQLFLDCVLAARRKLHLTYVGHSQKDDSECAPSSVLAELFDTVERCAVAPDGHGSAVDWLIVHHPLQTWSPRYRDRTDPRLFTYASAVAADTPVGTLEDPPWFDAPLPETDAPAAAIALDRLLEFWWHPCRFFLRHGLGVLLTRDSDSDLTTETFGLSALDRWRLLEAELQRALDGRPASPDPLARARATGLLPTGGSGIAAFAAVHEEQLQLLGELERRGALHRRSIAVHAPDFAVAGDLPQVANGTLLQARASKIKPKDRLRAWVLHVVAAVARTQGADLPTITTVISRNKNLRYRELEPDVASACLADLVAGYRLGQRAPLPFFERSSHAYGEALHKHPKDVAGALRKARRGWFPDTSEFAGSDSEDAAIALCMRDRDPFSADFEAWAARIWRAACGYSEDAE